MASLVLTGDTSGQVTIAAPAVAGTNTATLPAATGTVMVSGNMPAFGAYSNTNQTVSNNTGTVLSANTEEFDTAGCYNNTGSTVTLNGLSVPAYSFCPNIAGYYQINARATCAAQLYTAVNQNFYIYLRKNGSFISTGSLSPSWSTTSSIILTSSYSDVLYLAKNDTIDIIPYNDKGSGNLFASPNFNYIAISKISV